MIPTGRKSVSAQTKMPRKSIRNSITITQATGTVLLTALLASAALFAQSTPARSSSSSALEFPVTMRQNVSAGKTPVGTKIEARLTVATLVHGVVVPQDAILSGEVTESVAKSASDPSRLALHMDSARWKNGSAPIDVYLTVWYYPATLPSRDLSDDPMSASHAPATWNGAHSQSPFPNTSSGSDRDRDRDTGLAPPAPSLPAHPVPMKDVESSRNPNGIVTLTSKRSNIKLDKATTYVLATSDLAASPN